MVESEHVAVQWKPAELAGLLSPFEKAAAASAVPTLCNCEPCDGAVCSGGSCSLAERRSAPYN